MGSADGLAADDVGCLAADCFGAAGFFFFAGAAAARDFFLGSAAVALPLEEDAAASSTGLFSTDVFGFLGTVVGW